MILRRFMKHITDQNWFAVGLDVIVVIVGIFLGLQVQAWYEDQANLELEQNYLVKLHTDADQLIQIADGFTNSTLLIRDNIHELVQMLNENQDESNFTRLHCNSLTFTHIYVTRIVSLPTMDELFSSGQILLIKNEKIRKLISEFKLRTERTMLLINSLQADKLDFPREYSQIIKLKSLLAGNQESFKEMVMECDYQMMLESDEFKNRLIGNNARYGTYVIAIIDQLEILHNLHDALEQELGINHEESTS